MIKERDKFATDTYQNMSHFINASGYDDMRKFIELFQREHGTIQQKFMKLCMSYVYSLTELPSWRVDMRNEEAVRVAKEIVDKVKNYNCLPLI